MYIRGGTMNITEIVRILLVKKGNISDAELARRLGTTPQNLNNKMRRNNFKVSELEEIANALDCELEITFKEKVAE